MRHVAIFSNDLEALDGFGVADDIVEKDWSVFLYPVVRFKSVLRVAGDGGVKRRYHGSS